VKVKGTEGFKTENVAEERTHWIFINRWKKYTEQDIIDIEWHCVQ
jgi:hypothetical protein